jgi:hypothetical protein
MSINDVPIDVLSTHILPYLGLRDLIRAKMVSTRWQLAAIRVLKKYKMTKVEGYLALVLNDIGLNTLIDIPHKCLVLPHKGSIEAISRAIEASKSIYINGKHKFRVNEVKLANISGLTHISLTNMGDIYGQTLDNIITYSPNLSSLELKNISSCIGFNPMLLSRIKRLKLVGAPLNGVERFISVYNQANMLDYLYIKEAYVSQKALKYLKWAKELHYIYNSPAEDQELSTLMKLNNIRSLAIDKISDDQLKVITKNNQISKLHVDGGQLTDSSLQYFQGIKSVHVYSNSITDHGLKYLNQAESISIASQGLATFNLMDLNASRTVPLRALRLIRWVNLAAMRALFDPSIGNVDIRKLILAIIDIGPIAHLFSNIEDIRIYIHPVSDNDLSHFHNCKKIVIDNASKITDAGLYHLRNVGFIYLYNANSITNEGLQWLKNAIYVQINHNGNITRHDCLNGVPSVNIWKS